MSSTRVYRPAHSSCSSDAMKVALYHTNMDTHHVHGYVYDALANLE